MNHTPMTKIIEKGYDVTIEYEHTVATRQFENYKPKLTATVPMEDATGMMALMRKMLSFEEVKIKNDFAGQGGNNEQ